MGTSPESIDDFLKCVVGIRREWFDDDDPWGPWFRGQQRAYWDLLPKLYREYGGLRKINKGDIEDEIQEEFIVRAPILSETRPASDDEWEWYFLMQHFGTPTRLLDWTEGALIGLYFAVKENPGYYDAAVWVLDPYELNDAAIGREEVIPPSAPGVTREDKKLVKPWLPARFTKMIGLPERPIAVYPTHIARRISTQRSCFTVHGTDTNGIKRLHALRDGHLVKIVMPSLHVRTIKRELANHGIDEATIFPDLDGLSRAVAARWKVDTPTHPHAHVYTRLRPSTVHKGGVGVFAIRKVKRDTRLFLGDNEEMLWIDEKAFQKESKQIRKLYDDFAVIRNGLYRCPQNFNRLTMAWYVNEPNEGTRPNVRFDEESSDFFALRDIKPGEELTVDYSTYSDQPPGVPK